MTVAVGTSSWTDPTLLASGWYPASAKTAEARLAYYADQFSLVEVDSTYYGMPSERNAGLWVDRTPKHFTFDIKAFALFTKHAAPVRGIPKVLREALDESVTRVYAKDLPASVMDEAWEMFRSALMPLHSAGKLGAVFFQFPEWFAPSLQNIDYLSLLKDKLPDYRIAVEFRRGTWLDPPERAERTFKRLQDLGYAYVCVDMPQGFDSSLPPEAIATSNALSVVRFHGRNKQNWKRKGITAAERFDYLYTRKQLEAWAQKIAGLAMQSRDVHVLFNNCYADKGVRNAAQMSQLLDVASL